MSNFILEIVFTIIVTIPLVLNAIAGHWPFVALDATIVILGIVNSILAYKNYKKKKNRENEGLK